MRVTSIDLISNETEPMTFNLRPTSTSSHYIIRNIIGLDADEIISKFYGFSKDGTKRFYDFKLRQREIVIRIMLNPQYALDKTNSDIRDELYKVISGTRTGQIDLEFHAGASTVARISGHVIKFEVPYFSNEPELQITIKCNDPMFRSVNPVLYEEADLPSSNPIILADSESNAPHGFSMQLTMTATLANFTIQDKASSPEWDFKVIPLTSFLSGDVLHFSSDFNNRYLYMVRSGVTTQLVDRIDPTSVWPIIFPGFNEFHFTNIASFDWDFIQFNGAFWGV